ncbi:MAG: hypothetical protein NZ937_04085 [Armatimonadetes bacterium]|nr:hypothetical protein [Armatimonadota bacterium]
MRRRLRYFRLFALMTIVLVIVVGIYLRIIGQPEPQPNPSEVEVIEEPKLMVVAATDLMPRTLLTSDLLEEVEVKIVPEGAFTNKNEALNRLTKTLIRKGEPIFRQHLTPPLKELSAAYLIPPGQVGMALVIARPETVPPVKVGDYISVHTVFTITGRVKTIVPRAMVLAINNRIGEALIASTAQSSQPQQQVTQQQQAQVPQTNQLVLFVALSPMEAKAVALAMDIGSNLYYTLHPAPITTILPLANLERDLTLRELIGIPTVAPRGVRPSPPSPPVTLAPVSPQLNRLETSVRELSKRVEILESQTKIVTPRPVPVKERRIIGVYGDQKVVFSMPQSEGGR